MSGTSAAQAIVDACSELYDTPREVHGPDTILMDGPEGVWKIRMHRRGQQYTVKVTTPRGTHLYSVDGVYRSMIHDFKVTDLTCQHNVVSESCDANVSDNRSQDLSISAATLIQCAYRGHLIVRSYRRSRDLEREFDRMLGDLQEKITRANVERDARIVKLSATDTCIRMIPKWTTLSSENVSIGSTMLRKTNYTRDVVNRIAFDRLQTHSEESIEFSYAKAVVRTYHYPLILGVLPLPTKCVQIRLADGPLFAMPTDGLSDVHRKTLNSAFRKQWTIHLAHFTSQVHVQTFDVFSDRRKNHYDGSVVLSKFLYVSKGKVLPLVCIDSIVTSERRKSQGTRIVQFCRALVFEHGQRKGMIVAQCLPIPFWEDILDPSPIARAVFTQLNAFLPEFYELEEDCTARANVIEVDDDKPSPKKQLVVDVSP